MFRSYLTVALRNLRREKVYAGINVLGLAVAIACVLLVFLYVRHEFSFDDFHEKGDRIYRIAEYGGHNEKKWAGVVQGDPVPEMRASYPEVEDVATMYNIYRNQRIENNGQTFRDVPATYAEPNLFSIFSFKLLEGEAAALARPNTAVLSQSLARKAFGEESPLGKVFSMEVSGEKRQIEVTGVVEDIPANSHFRYDLFLSYETLRTTKMCLTCGGNTMFVLLKPGASPEPVAKRVLARIRTVDEKDHVDDVRLLPLNEVYLSEVPVERNGDRKYIYLLSTIAAVMLLIACANYMNLATARSARRAREVGIRKTVGAHRGQLARQFLVEGLLLVLVAVPLAVVLLVLAIPIFNDLAVTDVKLDWGSMGPLLLAGAGVLALIGLLGGSYPALYLSAFRPVDVLKGQYRGGLSAAVLRRGLVVFQFAASVVLIAATIVVLRQLEYMQNKKLGFDADQIVMVKITVPELAATGATVKEEFLRIPGIVSATASKGLPGIPGFAWMRTSTPLGEDGPKFTLMMPTIDSDFLRTMGIPLVAGRNIKAGLGLYGAQEGLVNERAVRAFGWESAAEAVGQKIGFQTVVGVVPDFNYESLHHPVEPAILLQNPYPYVGVIGLRLQGGNVRETLAALEQTWKRLAPGEPFEFSFLRDEMNTLYEKEQRAAKVFGTFAGLAILLACLGLFGLASFTAEQRTKEIGIRKVLGATIPGLIGLLSRDFLKLVLVAFLVALPVAYYAMQRWLEDFAYRIEVGPAVFLLAGGAAVLIAMASVGYQAVRAALVNPIESLRYE